MTSVSESKQENEINIDSKQCIMDNEQSISTVTQQSSDSDQRQDETNEIKQSNDSTLETEEKNVVIGINNDDALMNASPPIVTIDEEQQQEAREPAVNNDEDEHRLRKSFHPRVKYSSMPYNRPAYYTNGHPYGPASYYYYSVPSIDKPAPLMFIPTPQSPSSSSSQDNQTGNSTAVSPQNLPPRLRQISTAETESTSQVPSNTPVTLQPPTATNGRRHRSILPHGASNYYSPHPPPPLMATPPGVLYPYPSAVHQPGHIAYAIRPPDELELYAFQQQLMNLPPTSVIWPPQPPTALSPHGHPHYPSYPMNRLPPAYLFSNSTINQPTNSFLNPDAAEWVPTHNDHDSSSSDNNILIDDEINFPPLNSTINNTQTITTAVIVKDPAEDTSEQIETTSDLTTTNDNHTDDAPPTITDSSNTSTESNPKNELPSISSSSQDDNNKPLSSSSLIKVAPVTYSTITSQAADNRKSNKSNPNNHQQHPLRQPEPPKNHVHNQLPPRDRTVKQLQQQRTQMTPPSPASFNSRRRQPFNNNRMMTRNLLPTETTPLSKPQPQVTDDWIEVKSKKTKKTDRNLTDSSTEKFILDEQIHQSISPSLSLTSTGDNTTATFTSEDDYDEKDNQDLVIIMDKIVVHDYNQLIVDDIHNRLDNNERLLIIMRGCPGSGKSTLANSLNHGYNGIILSTDDYFTDNNLNKYVFDLNKLDDAHRYNRRRASDAFKRNVSPIIIDNTNTQTWEMKPYVAMGKDAGYDILLIEPQTPWRYKAQELFKRNHHNVPIKRIREMLNRFEHNVTVQGMINKLPLTKKPVISLSSEQENFNRDTEIIDPILTSKKFYDIIDDSLILDDVRLCINDMISFLTSNFYQTTLLSSSLTLPTTTTATTSPSSTPLSVSFHDLSLISPSSITVSLPSTPSTPHSRFPRQLTRFSSTTNQDHSFGTDHILRLPTSTFSRCVDTTILTPPLSAQSSLLTKKRRKNKNKQPSTDLVLNSNNNNNNNHFIDSTEHLLQTQPTFNVFLPEDCLDFVVIDEQNNHDWIDNVNRNFDIQINPLRDYSSPIPSKQNHSKHNDLLNIIHQELNKPAYYPSTSSQHIAIQCSANDFTSNSSDRILIGHLPSSLQAIITPSLALRPGYNDCGIQVDLNDIDLDSLIEIYSNRLSSEIIEQFYDVCHQDIQWTRAHIEEYLQENSERQVHIPTLRQLSLKTLSEWNEQIKCTNPLFDTISVDDLLEDINDDEVLEDLTSTAPRAANIEFTEFNQVNIPWSIVNSLEELYGEIPDKSVFSSNSEGISLPFDHDLSINIYQALQRFAMKSTQTIKPMIENKRKTDNNNNHNQRWKLPLDNQVTSDVHTNQIPSFKQIMHEEQQAAKCQKSKQKRQLDFATEHKFKELERHFPSFDANLLYDIFCENEYNYDITFICISTMLDDHASITSIQEVQAPTPARLITTTKTIVEPVLESYDILRRDALRHAQQRKELYTKAHQAKRHGMSGVASFYIHRASKETQLMKEANRAACERLSRWKLRQFHQTQQLDLHGLHSDEALQLFQQIEQEFHASNRRTTPKSIEIITGYGKNSIYGGGHGKIRSIILTYIQQRNYKYSEINKGVILLQLSNVRN